MEARSEVADVLNRKCIIIRWSALSSEKFLDIIHRGAGAIFILLPAEWGQVEEVRRRGGLRTNVHDSNFLYVIVVNCRGRNEIPHAPFFPSFLFLLSFLPFILSPPSLLKEWYALEQDLLSSEVPIPVYFALESPELGEIHDRITDSAERNKDSSVAGSMHPHSFYLPATHVHHSFYFV